MSRLIVLVAVAALVIGLPLTHDAFAAKNVKVTICHVNSSNTPGVYEWVDYYYYYGNLYDWGYKQVYYLGNMIEVDESSLPAHYGHGDPNYSWPLDDYVAGVLTTWEDWNYLYEWYYSEDYYGAYGYQHVNAVIKNADCYGVIW